MIFGMIDVKFSVRDILLILSRTKMYIKARSKIISKILIKSSALVEKFQIYLDMLYENDELKANVQLTMPLIKLKRLLEYSQ